MSATLGSGTFGSGNLGDPDYVQVIDIGGESTTEPKIQVRVTLRRAARLTTSTESAVQVRTWSRRAA